MKSNLCTPIMLLSCFGMGCGASEDTPDDSLIETDSTKESDTASEGENSTEDDTGSSSESMEDSETAGGVPGEIGCRSTGDVDSYSWRKGIPELLDGRSILDLLEMVPDEIELDVTNLCQYLKLYDYPDSRDSIKKEYTYTYKKDIKRPTRQGSGLNMNGLDAPEEGAWGSFLEDRFFKIVADAGFDIVRIPVRFEFFLESTDPIVADETFLKRVDRALDSALENDLTVILEIHYFPDKDILRRFESEDEKERIINQLYELWDILAERYKAYPETLYFELINEPRLPLSHEIWNDALKETLARIRATGGNNATRKIVIGPAGWSHVGMLETLDIPTYEEDPNLLVTVHYYEPFSFTWQGVSWGPYAMFGPAWTGNVWTGTDYQKKIIRDDLDLVADWANEHSRTIVLSEFGVRYVSDRDSRAMYLEFVREEAEERGFSWLVWSFNANDSFGFYDPEDGWQLEILDALIPE